MRTLSLPNVFFEEAAEMLRNGKKVKMRINGESMYPFLHSGRDLVELHPHVGDELPLWTVVFYRWEGNYMIHRIIGVDMEGYDIMGDGNGLRVERITKDEVIGVLRYIHYSNGKVQDCEDPKWLARGRYWHKLLPIRMYLIRAMRLLRI